MGIVRLSGLLLVPVASLSQDWNLVCQILTDPSFNSPAMARLSWLSSALACSSMAFAQSSTSSQAADGLTAPAYGSPTTTTKTDATATVSGKTSTYSIPFTVPASADVGANVLPNIKDPSAPNAQVVCPGYKASNVSHTQNGFTAVLNLAGPAVCLLGEADLH